VNPVLATAIVGAVTTTTVGLGYAVAAPATGPDVQGPGLVTVGVDVEYSTFELDDLQVRPGTTVQFIVRNRDPISHELVVGEAAVHARHRAGRERAHPPVPGEVSVGPHDDGVTFYEFDRPGTYAYACHLPGHVAYGMVGEIVVVADEAGQ
jgi:plastocyanin